MIVKTIVPSTEDSHYPGQSTGLFPKFIADLRSGKINQTKGVLWRTAPDESAGSYNEEFQATHQPGMCCIGVGARRVSIEKPDAVQVTFAANNTMAFNGDESIAGAAVYDGLFSDRRDRQNVNAPLWVTGLSMVEMSTLHGGTTSSFPITWDGLNDVYNLTFSQIADVLCWAVGADENGYAL